MDSARSAADGLGGWLAALGAVGTVDLVLLAVLGLSVRVGLFRGLVFEVLSLAGWVVAYFAAAWFAPELAPWIPVGEPGSALNHSAALVVGFMGTLVAWGVAARVVRWVVAATPLSLPDRVLGAGFGALRGLVLLLAIATAVQLTPAAQSTAWRHSQLGPWLVDVVDRLRPLLPPELARLLPPARGLPRQAGSGTPALVVVFLPAALSVAAA